jgi:REDY-like protein HapK
MATVVYLFDLDRGIEPADYETWARTVDLPAVRGLPCVSGYRIFRAPASSPPDGGVGARYMEVLDVTSPEDFQAQMATPEMVAVAAAFGRYAATPLVLVLDELQEAEAHHPVT